MVVNKKRLKIFCRIKDSNLDMRGECLSREQPQAAHESWGPRKTEEQLVAQTRGPSVRFVCRSVSLSFFPLSVFRVGRSVSSVSSVSLSLCLFLSSVCLISLSRLPCLVSLSRLPVSSLCLLSLFRLSVSSLWLVSLSLLSVLSLCLVSLTRVSGSFPCLVSLSHLSAASGCLVRLVYLSRGLSRVSVCLPFWSVAS